MDEDDDLDDGSVAAVWGTPAPPRPDVLGPRYERGGLLGVGGMGRVFAARDRVLDRDVALKECRPDAPAGRGRLEREARITARLEHPAILPVYDAGEDDAGAAWYVMRLVRGEALSERLAGRPLAERLGCLRPFLLACQAVAYAHSRGVVHRDLKPDNILLGAFGETQVADWGLALEAGEDDSGPVGTPGYMSPEQRQGGRATPPSDVWSLGAVLWEVATGGDAQGVDVGSPLGEAQLDAAGAPAALGGVIRKALSARPEDRYPDAAALAADLERFLDGRRVLAHEYSAGELLGRLVRLWRAPLVVGLVGSVLLAAALIVGWVRAEAERGVARASLSRALTEQALAADRAGEPERAEELAWEALRWAESAEARSVLAGLALRPRPTRREATPVASSACDQVALLGGSRWACRVDRTVRGFDGDRLLWETTLETEGVLAAAPPDLYVPLKGGPLVRLDPATGEEERRWPVPSFAEKVKRIDADLALAWRGDRMALVGADGHQSLPWCDDGGGVAVAASAPGGLLVICVDHRLGYVDPRDPPEALVDSLPNEWRLTGLRDALHLDGSRFGLVTSSGLLVIDAVGPRLLARHPITRSGLVEAARRPGGGLLLRSERGAVFSWDPAAEQALRLPIDGARDLLLEGDALVTLGRRLTRWSLPPEGPGWRLGRGPGISAVAVRPDGLVAAPRGTGEVTLWDPRTRSVRTVPMFGGVIKDFAFDPAGRGYAVSAVAETTAMRTVDPETTEVTDVPAGSTYRRVAHVDGVGVVGVSYSPTSPLRTPAQEVLMESGAIYDLAAAGSMAVMRAGTGEVVLAQADGGKLVERWRRSCPGAGPVAVSDEGLVAAGNGAGACLFDADGVDLGPVPGGNVTSVALSPAGDVLALGTLDGRLSLVRLADRTVLSRGPAHEGRVSGIVFAAPDEIVTGGWDGAVQRWGLGPLGAPRPKRGEDADHAGAAR